MQSTSSRIWTRVAVFISYNDIHYTTGTSMMMLMMMTASNTKDIGNNKKNKNELQLGSWSVKLVKIINYNDWQNFYVNKSLKYTHFYDYFIDNSTAFLVIKRKYKE